MRPCTLGCTNARQGVCCTCPGGLHALRGSRLLPGQKRGGGPAGRLGKRAALAAQAAHAVALYSKPCLPGVEHCMLGITWPCEGAVPSTCSWSGGSQGSCWAGRSIAGRAGQVKCAGHCELCGPAHRPQQRFGTGRKACSWAGRNASLASYMAPAGAWSNR